jgi:hypothetical protein
MARKKRRKAADEAGVTEGPEMAPAPAPEPQAPEPPADDWRAQRSLSTVGFGACGLAAGFLTGANSLSVAAASGSRGLVEAAWVGALLGGQQVPLGPGLAYGLVGLVVGSTFGWSVFYPAWLMWLSWLLAAAGMAALWIPTGSPVAGALGWLGCWALSLVLAARVKLGPGFLERASR